MSDPATLQAGLRRVRETFVGRLPECEAAVLELVREIRAHGARGVSADRARGHLHRIAGTAPTLGFADLGHSARIGEDELLRLRRGEPVDADALTGLLEETLDRMRRARA